jgi:hypothetical protein
MARHDGRHGRVVFEPLQRAAAGRLGRLHPLAALLAHPHDDAVAGQRALPGVEVGRAQALADGVALPDRSQQRRQPVRRDLQLQFEFGHGAAPAPRRRGVRAPGLHKSTLPRPAPGSGFALQSGR